MANEAELKINSDSIVRTNDALDALIDGLEKLEKQSKDTEKETDNLSASEVQRQKILKQSEALMGKAIAFQQLHEKGLKASSETYAKQRAAILANELAVKKGLDTSSEEFKQLEENITKKELAIAATKRKEAAERGAVKQQKQAASLQKEINRLLTASEATAKRDADLLELKRKGLDESSDAYIDEAAAIEARDRAARKGISTSSKEYKQLERSIKVKRKAAAETKKLTKELEEANKEASKNEGMKRYANKLDEVATSASLLDGPMGGVASRLTSLSSILKGSNGPLIAGIAALSAGLAAVAATAVQGAKSLDESNRYMASLEAQLAATGYNAGITAEEIKRLNRELQVTALVPSESLKEATKTMLTFKNISSDVYERAIRGAVDLGAALSQDPTEAAQTLGQVLQNPLEEINALNEASIVFTATEREQIKEAQRLGEMYKAQDIILSKIEERYKGVAAAQGDSLAGDVADLSQSWDDVSKKLGRAVLPLLRSSAQFTDSMLESLNEFMKTSADEAGDAVFEQNKKQAYTAEQLKKNLADLQGQLKKNAEAQEVVNKQYENSTKMGRIARIERRKGLSALADEEAAIRKKIESFESLQRAQKGEGTDNERYSEVEIVIKQLELQARQEREITKAFAESGDTRSTVYRHILADQQALAEAEKEGLNVTDEHTKRIRSLYRSISDLTEARVIQNSVIESTKAQRAKQKQLQDEIDLLALVQSGVEKSSQAYVVEAARREAINTATQAKIKIGSDEHKQIEQSMIATAKLTRELEVLQALKESSATGANFRSLERELDMQELLDTGVKRTSRSFIRYAAAYDARNKAARLGLETGSEEYKQLLKQADILAILKADLQEMTNLKELGFSVNNDGEAVVTDSVEGVELERQEKLNELKRAWEDGEIDNERAYRQRLLDVETEYHDKAMQKRQEQFEKSAEHKDRMRNMEVAGELETGLKTLSVVMGNNKKLAKAAKAMSLFKASTSLVDSIAAASAQPFPVNVPLIAQAFAQGTKVVQMASSLNEPSFAFGGVDIEGAGTARSDSINAKIARGESVITATATQRHKETLRRMNQGLPIGNSSGPSVVASPTINIQGDASENTVRLIDESLRNFETRVAQISQGVSVQTIQDEQEVGGLFDPI